MNSQSIARASKFFLSLAFLCTALAFTSQAQTLGEALNATNLIWTTGGSAPWIAETGEAYSGNIFYPESNWIQTTVSGPAAVSFSWSIAGTAYCSLTFSIGGVDQADAIRYEFDSGQFNNIEAYVPPGNQTLLWTYTTAPGSGYISPGGAWLAGVSLSAAVAPTILTQPTTQTILSGATASFAVSVSGTPPLSLQWRQDGVDLPGVTNASWSIPNTEPTNSGDYTVVVSNMVGSVTSQAAGLVVVPVPPTFTLQPVSQTVAAGSNVIFTAAATGSEPMTWLWAVDQRSLSGTTNASLVLTNVQTADAGAYVAVISNVAGIATSQVATLTVYAAPVVTGQPVSLALPPSATASFGVGAVGVPPLTWQWIFQGNLVAGATTSTLSVTNVSFPDYGTYWAVVSNSYGSATTATATLSFSPVIVWGDNEDATLWVAPDATNVLALTGGDGHVLALRADGTVTTWGKDYWATPQQAEVPPTATNVVGIAAGSGHSLAVRADGTVVLWGVIIGDRTTNVPPQATNVVALAEGSGAQHALALRADGTVVDWGDSGYGLTNVPANVTNIIAVSVGAFHSLALRGDGTLVAWGDNSEGQTDIPASASNVVAISSGWFHNLALRADGNLVQWGNSWYVSVGRVPAEATNIVDFSCGGNHSLALRADGKLLAWGNTVQGVTAIPAWATNLAAVAGTGSDSLALIGDGPALVAAPLVSRSVRPGQPTYFRAIAVGALPLSYQWELNGIPIPGATNSMFAVANARVAQAGSYSFVVSNALGMATSAPAVLTVMLPESSIIPSSILSTNGILSFAATSPAGRAWSLQGSSDLSQWLDLTTVTNTTGTMIFNQVTTNLPCQFFRLRWAQ